MVTRWPPRTPVNPAHTIGGMRGVRGVLGEGGVSLVRRVCPHASRGGTFADDSRRFAIVAAVLGGLWWFYLRREWQAHVFGNAVARASEHPVQLRRQNRELAHVDGNNNITGVDLGTEKESGNRQFWGWHELCFVTFFWLLFVLRTWNQNFFSLSRRKILQCSPYLSRVQQSLHQNFTLM